MPIENALERIEAALKDCRYVMTLSKERTACIKALQDIEDIRAAVPDGLNVSVNNCAVRMWAKELEENDPMYKHEGSYTRYEAAQLLQKITAKQTEGEN